MRVESKDHLLDTIESSWQALLELLSSVDSSESERRVRLPNSSREESIKDILAHLLGWHQLFLGWYKTGKAGTPELPVPGLKWNQTPILNQQIFDEWKDVPYTSVKRRLQNSHKKILQIANSNSEKELMTPGVFLWTGKLTLAKYIAPNTASHYKWAIKKIKKTLKAHA